LTLENNAFVAFVISRGQAFLSDQAVAAKFTMAINAGLRYFFSKKCFSGLNKENWEIGIDKMLMQNDERSGDELLRALPGFPTATRPKGRGYSKYSPLVAAR
jgi:hypothetical protein